MVTKTKIKTTIYPRPHTMQFSWAHSVDGTQQEETMLPIIMYDEGLGNPNSFTAHPENATFGTTDAPNCYPDSKVNSAFIELRFSLTKEALQTDKLPAVRLGYMPIGGAFLDDWEAKDEGTGFTPESVLEVQHETTDRQAYPLYNGTKVVEKFAGSATLDAAVPGLTTTQVMEGVSFNASQYYNSQQFLTISNKIKKISKGLRWIILSPQKPIQVVRIRIGGNTKFMNPYTFYGIMTTCPLIGQTECLTVAADSTNVSHVYVDAEVRYLEWNEGFDFDKQ